jgi:trk system potassium uptake protein
MDFRPIFYVIGVLLGILAASMILPMLVDLYSLSSDWRVFFLSIVITAFFSGSLILSNGGQKFDLSIRQAFVLTALSWLVLGLFSAMPFYMSELGLNYTDAFFEAMSGITTTGATVITGLDTAPKGILLWRGILHMLGGLGFVVMGISVLPLLRVGGMRLFRTESSEKEKALPRAAENAKFIAMIFLLLTFLCMMCFMFTGMSLLDATVHAMSAVATGGFANYDASFASFTNPWARIIAITFMLAGSLPFILYIRALRGDMRPLLKDQQVRVMLLTTTGISLVMAAYLSFDQDTGFFDALLRALFNVTSVITTTGFVSEDYGLWGATPIVIFFFITFIGGCSGSTSGGIKIFRFQVMFAVVGVQIKKLLYPHGTFIAHYNKRPIPPDVPASVMVFFFMFMMVLVMGTICVSLTGIDFMSSISAVVSCLSNVGPGLGTIAGPSGTYAPFSDTAIWILSVCMLLGRLELFTLLVLFSPYLWKP